MSRPVILALALALLAGCNETRRDRPHGGQGGPAGSQYGPPISPMPYVIAHTGSGTEVRMPIVWDAEPFRSAILEEVDSTVPENSPTGLTWAEEGGAALGVVVYVGPCNGWWSPNLPNGGRGKIARGEHSRAGRWICVALGPPVGVEHTTQPLLEALAHEMAHELRYIPDDGSSR